MVDALRNLHGWIASLSRFYLYPERKIASYITNRFNMYSLSMLFFGDITNDI